MSISGFISLVSRDLGYNEQAKKRFHRESGQILKQLATELGYTKTDYDLRHNQAGIAVSGEITLHSDNLYVQFSQTSLGPDTGFMWRTCKNRKDYGGGPNQWAKWEELNDLPRLAQKMKSLALRGAA